MSDDLTPLLEASIHWQELLSGARRWVTQHGSMLDVLPLLPADCFDSCVCDPPYELGFMGRKWDSSGIAFRPETWAAVLRVLKPGAHLVAFGGSRTAHRIAVAIEDAGFEIRDSKEWIYGSGFPKSLDIFKGITNQLGIKRGWDRKAETALAPEHRGDAEYLCPPEAIESYGWEGWGTALKPGHEPIILARKPVKKTIVSNVLEFGTGALNIDACRVAHSSAADLKAHSAGVNAIKARGGTMENSWKNSSDLANANDVNTAGRWPPNVLFTHSGDCKIVGAREVKAAPSWDTPNRECVPAFTGPTVSKVKHGGQTESVRSYECAPDCPVRELDEQSGQSTSTGGTAPRAAGIFGITQNTQGLGDTGTASRYFPQSHWDPGLDDFAPFFYTAKASRAERDRGLDDFRAVSGGEATGRVDGSAGTESPRAGAGRKGGARNVHPTVKPIELLRWLCRLVTRPKGLVLDPFSGVASCGVACMFEGFRYFGIELNDTELEPYVSIGRARLEWVIGGDYSKALAAKAENETTAPAVQGSKQMRLF